MRNQMRGALVQSISQRALWQVLVELVSTLRPEQRSEIVPHFEMNGIIRN
jgi:hypothetical protein